MSFPLDSCHSDLTNDKFYWLGKMFMWPYDKVMVLSSLEIVQNEVCREARPTPGSAPPLVSFAFSVSFIATCFCLLSLSRRCVSVFSLPGSGRPCNGKFISPAQHPVPFPHTPSYWCHTQTTCFLKNLWFLRGQCRFLPYVLFLEEGAGTFHFAFQVYGGGWTASVGQAEALPKVN